MILIFVFNMIKSHGFHKYENYIQYIYVYTIIYNIYYIYKNIKTTLLYLCFGYAYMSFEPCVLPRGL